MEIVGQTIDDAAGEAFDKCAKVLELPYPGGPHIDRLAQTGNAKAFTFNKPQLSDYNYSFSGLKTSFLYLIRDRIASNPNFIEENKTDLCASIQQSVIDILMSKLTKAAKDFNIKNIAIAGGVSANTCLRRTLLEHAAIHNWEVHIPDIAFTTDNAAMIAITGYFNYQNQQFGTFDQTPFSRISNKL
jgi:N6-L-threonylcarbamoyladenine synthase